MKRLTVLLLILSMLLCGCMSQEERQERVEALRILNGGNPTEYALSTGTALENQLLLDTGDLAIQLAGITGTPDAPELVVAIRNTTGSTVNIFMDYALINGWQVDCWCDLYDVPDHGVAVGTITFDEALSLCALQDISDIALAFYIYDEDYEETCSAYCQMSTSAGATSFNEPDGETLLNENGFLVQATGLENVDGCGTLSLYLENNTSRRVYAETRHIRLNGEPVELWVWCDLTAGGRRLTSMEMTQEDTYESLALSEEDVLSFDLFIIDYDTGGTLAQQHISLSPQDFAPDAAA